ncbi:MAG: hypothetical protein A2Z88_10025 [Omnitrophica WOR_2 bacterium GWA2_47_8]|nr:MAG: hypothetical protein A2Z88_10025 [Omnitrophica WOR_2 bacterium GWA2_47_8]
MKPRIFIFDFDGTIADTYRHSVEIFNQLAEEFHYKPILPEEVAKLKNKSSLELIRYFRIPILKLPAIIAKGKKKFEKRVSVIEPISGIKECLTQLKNSGTQLGILSSNSRELIIGFLNNHRMDMFDFVHTTSKVWSKNISLQKLIFKNRFRKEQIVYVGDEVRDILAAQKLGIKIAAVTWGYNSAQNLQQYNPDFLIHKPEELTALAGL